MSNQKKRLIGYARVSTDDQNLDMQIQLLKEHGCTRIFQEKVSAGARSRPEFHTMMAFTRPGDVIVVYKIDRLARTVFELIKMSDTLEREGVEIRSLTQPIDTTSAMGKAFFGMIAVFAELERNMISERTKAGVKRARERGVRFGAKPKVDEKMLKSIAHDLENTRLTGKRIAENHGIAYNTLKVYFPGLRKMKVTAKAVKKKASKRRKR